MKGYSSREFKKILSKNGYIRRNQTGDHETWKHAETGRIITFINNPSSGVNPWLAHRLIKRYDLKE